MGSGFYSDAFSPAKRTSPIDNTDFELNDAYKPTGSTTQPERSLTGGATAPNPGAGNNPYAPPGSSASVATPGAGTSQPGTVNDPYAPMLKHLSDASQNLESAYAAPHSGAARQIIGAVLSRRNPALGGIVSGETQRNRGIEQAQEDYGIASSQLTAARTQQNQQVENNLKNKEAEYYSERGGALANPPMKPTPEEAAIQDYQGKINPATNQKYSPAEAFKQVQQDKQDVKPDPQAKQQTPDEQAMSALMNQINPRTRKPYTAFEARMRLAAGLESVKPNTGATEHDMEPVMAYDQSGKAHIVPKSEAMAPGSGYSNVIKATDKDLNDANTHAVVLNDMQSKLNDVVGARRALDQGADQRAIISKVLSHSEPGMINDSLNAFALSNATQQTKDYIQKVLSLKESALGLPKEITGGSRTSEIQGNALFQTLPSGASVDSKYALDQAKTFQGNIDRLRERVPAVRGMTTVPAHPDLSGGAGGAKLSRPRPNVVVEQ